MKGIHLSIAKRDRIETRSLLASSLVDEYYRRPLRAIRTTSTISKMIMIAPALKYIYAPPPLP